MSDKPITNAHAHCFTANHVPPLLAKSYLPWPFYHLLRFNWFVAIFRWYYNCPARWKYKFRHKRWIEFRTWVLIQLNKVYFLRVAAGYYVTLFACFQLYKMIRLYYTGKDSLPVIGHNTYDFLDKMFFYVQKPWISILAVALIFLYLPAVHNMVLMLLKLVWKPLTKIPGPQTKDLFERYLNIGRYAFHEQQKTIVSKLKSQYPAKTNFVLLPMDMDYMGAGDAKTRYRHQMEELSNINFMSGKNKILHPFVFADPRRFVKVENEKHYKKGDLTYFDYHFDGEHIQLKDCFIRQYLFDKNFTGIKIYPALGYYPFDEKLLPLWKYAADNQVPIMTHCIRGTIFYRGIKKQEWNHNPVFTQEMSKPSRPKGATDDGFKSDEQMEHEQESFTNYTPMVLPQAANVDFSYNFTNPLNYLCLLKEELLRKIIAAAMHKDPASDLKDIFGFTNADTPLLRNISHLKICLAHFGGEDEWKRYFEKDRYSYSAQLIKYPGSGISFLTRQGTNDPAKGKLEQLWKYGDWYSIICSMILQHENVYADISYILHGNEEIFPLLKETLRNDKLRSKVLYGTDFFVVRNHKSDKNM